MTTDILRHLEAGVLTLTLNVAAYMSETLRGAIGAVEQGQWLAGTSLGLSRHQTLRYIIGPQALRAAVPSLSNSLISLIKDTSLVSVITVSELMMATKDMIAQTFQPLPLYLMAAAICLLLATVPVLFKLGLVAALARLFGAPTGVALRTGLYLAQAGEFGFVLLNLAAEQKLLPHHVQSPLLASMVLSMLATPFIIHYSNWIVMKVSATDWLMQSLAMTKIASKAINTEKHVVICGYGRSGQNLARMLEQEHIPYMALDLDPDRLRGNDWSKPVFIGPEGNWKESP